MAIGFHDVVEGDFQHNLRLDHPAKALIFDRVLEDTQLVPGALKADADAIGDRDVYDDAYYDALFKSQRPIIEERLNRAIAGVAAAITGAWEAAGKPPMPVTVQSAVQRRRRP